MSPLLGPIGGGLDDRCVDWKLVSIPVVSSIPGSNQIKMFSGSVENGNDEDELPKKRRKLLL